MKGYQRPQKTDNDWQLFPKTQKLEMIVKDRQQHSATGNDYMETRLNN